MCLSQQVFVLQARATLDPLQGKCVLLITNSTMCSTRVCEATRRIYLHIEKVGFGLHFVWGGQEHASSFWKIRCMPIAEFTRKSVPCWCFDWYVVEASPINTYFYDAFPVIYSIIDPSLDLLIWCCSSSPSPTLFPFLSFAFFLSSIYFTHTHTFFLFLILFLLSFPCVLVRGVPTLPRVLRKTSSLLWTAWSM